MYELEIIVYIDVKTNRIDVGVDGLYENYASYQLYRSV